MNLDRLRSWALPASLAAMVALIYFYLTVWTDQEYLVQTLSLAGAFALAVVGLDILFGIAHQLNLGHAFFFGASAYVCGVLSGPSHNWPPLVAMAVGVAACTLIAYPIGLILLRLEGFFFAAATLGLAVMGQDLLLQLREVTGGLDGLSIVVFEVAGFRFDTPLRILLLTWVPAIGSVVIGRNFARSRRGLVARSIAEDEGATAAQGIDVPVAKTQLFLIAAGYASLGGALYGFASGFIVPGNAGIVTSIEMVVAVVLGGAGSIVGPVVGATFIRFLPHLFEPLEGRLDLVYGAVLIALLLVLPDTRNRPSWSPLRHLRRTRTQDKSTGVDAT